jgi:hypothetical protein
VHEDDKGGARLLDLCNINSRGVSVCVCGNCSGRVTRARFRRYHVMQAHYYEEVPSAREIRENEAAPAGT